MLSLDNKSSSSIYIYPSSCPPPLEIWHEPLISQPCDNNNSQSQLKQKETPRILISFHFINKYEFLVYIDYVIILIHVAVPVPALLFRVFFFITNHWNASRIQTQTHTIPVSTWFFFIFNWETLLEIDFLFCFHIVIHVCECLHLIILILIFILRNLSVFYLCVAPHLHTYETYFCLLPMSIIRIAIFCLYYFLNSSCCRLLMFCLLSFTLWRLLLPIGNPRLTDCHTLALAVAGLNCIALMAKVRLVRLEFGDIWRDQY